jgi:hypothetical protein
VNSGVLVNCLAGQVFGIHSPYRYEFDTSSTRVRRSNDYDGNACCFASCGTIFAIIVFSLPVLLALFSLLHYYVTYLMHGGFFVCWFGDDDMCVW